MGMLFNTEDTVKMVALVNRHFAAGAHGGAIDAWRDQKNEVKKFTKSIWALADDNDLVPEKDLAHKARGRWRKWLNQLGQEPAAVNQDPPPFDNPGTRPAGTLPADAATYTTVEKELRRQIFNALNDANCTEIAYTAIPGTVASMGGRISISKGQTVALSGTAYIYLINVATVRIDDIP